MVACGVWETITGRYFQIYLPWDKLVPSEPITGATIISLLVFFSYAIVLNTVVPISLYVRYGGCFFVYILQFCMCGSPARDICCSRHLGIAIPRVPTAEYTMYTHQNSTRCILYLTQYA